MFVGKFLAAVHRVPMKAKRLVQDLAVSVAVIGFGGFFEIDSGTISQFPACCTKDISSS